MDKLIQKTRFSDDDESKFTEFNDTVIEWSREHIDNVTSLELLKAIETFKKALTQSKSCPTFETHGWKAATLICYQTLIKHYVSDLMQKGKIQLNEVRAAYFNLYLDWFKYGAATVHLEIMNQTLREADINMKEYLLQSLTGKQHTDLISAITSPIKKKEDTQTKTYYDNHRRYMNMFISNAFDRRILIEKHMKIWTDYSFHLYFDYLHLDDASLYHVCEEAGDRFNEISEGWENFSEDSSLKSYLKKLHKTTKTPHFQKNENVVRVVGYSIEKLQGKYYSNKKYIGDWLSLIFSLLDRQCGPSIRAANIVIGSDNAILSKGNSFYDKVCNCITRMEVPRVYSNSSHILWMEMAEFLASLSRKAKQAGKLKDILIGLMVFGIYLLELRLPKEEIYKSLGNITESMDITYDKKKNKDTAMAVMRRVYNILYYERPPLATYQPRQNAFKDLILKIIEPSCNVKTFTDADFEIFVFVCRVCITKGPVNQRDGSLTASFIITTSLLDKIKDLINSTERMKTVKDQLSTVLNQTCLHSDKRVQTACKKYMSAFASLDTKYDGGVTQLLKLFAGKEMAELYSTVTNINYMGYGNASTDLQGDVNDFINPYKGDVLKMASQNRIILAIQNTPEMFTDTMVGDLLDFTKQRFACGTNTQIKIRGTEISIGIIPAFVHLSKKRPELFIEYVDMIMEPFGWDSQYHLLKDSILVNVASHDKTISPKVMDHLIENGSLQCILTLGLKCPEALKQRRRKIEQLQCTSQFVLVKKAILDLIDGKTVDDLKVTVTDQQGQLYQLGDKVDDVEETVVAVQEEVTYHGQRLDQVEGCVEETVVKVEELDSKTLSHAPSWSRDVSKLLNPATDHDWRLLSTRLGYSKNDIRGWAQHADPCMALLNEWYATRKASGATLSILTNLQEMNRMDAALIVENGLKKAETVVEDEEFDYASPPPIFISYQWGNQNEAKLLKRHLEMAGYECWMDIGQMGGGDKLFEKIDKGMRASKLLISCVTAQYAKSPNCNREVNLAIGVQKPIIPLLLEDCSWPPSGSMGPIFSESLYIRFFKSKMEDTKDERYWPEEKFKELLMQLAMNGLTPNESKVKPIYKNWWVPLQEEIKIDKNNLKFEDKTVQSTSHQSDNMSERSPEIFISYQWGKQKNIIELYKRLTSHGYSCWLDIKQMGGGDSLYDKIDKGIRGCKLVLSCVTKKYALSPNCRREVSLTDALKKPLVPLLLEEMAWPPSGPMGLVMTQLLYINCCQEVTQSRWAGPKFQEIITKINECVSVSQGTNIDQQQTEALKLMASLCSAKDGNNDMTSKETDPTLPGSNNIKKFPAGQNLSNANKSKTCTVL